MILLTVLVSVYTESAYAQTQISGQVNKYVSVTDVVPCDSMVRVGNALTLKQGDRILLIQMKGAKIVSTNTPDFGSITDLNGAGNAEFLTIEQVVGDEVTFTTRMVHEYDPNGSTQLVFVPVYSDARVSAPLTAPKWNGTTGGVIAIEVPGNLYLDSDISADGLGFSGGSVSFNWSRCSVQGYLVNWAYGFAGGKGDGVANLNLNYAIAGRGAFANGGGGGNGNNAGGAGGGNGGAGGSGGGSNLHCEGSKDLGGIGGRSMTEFIPDQRFYLGGGGGGGHQNDFVGTPGTSGGGIIIIRAQTLHGRNRRITSNGLNGALPPPPPPRSTYGMDGVGGGGAGGTIILDVENIASNVSVEVNGGNGGDIHHQFNAHGPGGGGGGGVIVLKQPSPRVTTSTLPGVAGIHLDSQNELYLRSHGALDGDTGVVVTSLQWRKPLSVELTISGGGAICQGESSVQLEAIEGFATYTWSDGQTGRIVSVSEQGSYSVVATDSAGCLHSANGLVVYTNPTLVTVPDELNFRDVPFEEYKRMQLPVRNDDDEDVRLFSVTNSANFTVIDPTAFPIIIPAGQTVMLSVEFYAVADRRYEESIYLSFDQPCTLEREVKLSALVSPIWADFHSPDTLAKIGDTTFSFPIYVDIRPDTIQLNASHLQISLTMDSRLFAPRSVTRGRIVRNTIDLIANSRSLTIEIDSIDLAQNDNVVTRVVGSVLMTLQNETPVRVSDAIWIKVWQEPITAYDDGSLAIDPVCFQEGRIIHLYDMITMSVSPNPVGDVMEIETNLSAPGSYEVQVVNIAGKVIHHQSFNHDGQDSKEHTIVINTSGWANGHYVVRYTTPFVVYTENIIVQH